MKLYSRHEMSKVMKREEIAYELWIAREMLSISASDRERTSSGTFVPVDKDWNKY